MGSIIKFYEVFLKAGCGEVSWRDQNVDFGNRSKPHPPTPGKRPARTRLRVLLLRADAQAMGWVERKASTR